MVFLLIIAEDKVVIEECEAGSAVNYRYLPDEDGLPITFENQESAQMWVLENVKPEYIAIPDATLSITELRSKYLVG